MDNVCCICGLHNHLRKVTHDSQVTYLEKLNTTIPEIHWLEQYELCFDCAAKVNEFYKFREHCLKNKRLILKNAPQDTPVYNIIVENKYLQSDNDTEIIKLNKAEQNEIIKSVGCKNINNRQVASVVHASYGNEEVEANDTISDNETEKETVERNMLIEHAEPNKTAEIKDGTKTKRTKKKEPIRCEHCGRDFKRREHLTTHIRSKHTLEKPYACDKCEARFSVSQSLVIHKRRHNNDRPYCCTYCGKQFSCSADLYHHNQIHLNLRKYKCSSCRKSFNTASILRRHKICAHTDQALWKYACNHCDRKFPMSGNLKTHLRRHENEKNFSCDICQKSFYDKFILQRHMRCHSDERLFKCNECKKEYKDNCSLNIHLKKVHDIGNATLPKRLKNFVCHMCPKAFTSDDKLKKHVNSHVGVRPFECALCDKKFTDSWYRKKHLQRKHDVTEET